MLMNIRYFYLNTMRYALYVTSCEDSKLIAWKQECLSTSAPTLVVSPLYDR